MKEKLPKAEIGKKKRKHLKKVGRRIATAASAAAGTVIGKAIWALLNIKSGG